jgi:CYTH domain-containing protein
LLIDFLIGRTDEAAPRAKEHRQHYNNEENPFHSAKVERPVFCLQPKMNSHTRNGREIERKFLVKELPPGLNRFRSFLIAQGYLANEPGSRHVRLRKKGKTASLTFKVGRSTSREEREIRLSPKQFAALWPATRGRRLRKVRYEIPWRKLIIEIDIYRGEHSGLVVAEVEFPNHAARRIFKPPTWFGREVTGEKRYSNIRLATE